MPFTVGRGKSDATMNLTGNILGGYDKHSGVWSSSPSPFGLPLLLSIEKYLIEL